MDLPEGYDWVQRDALKVRCLACGETITADVLDLHERSECSGGSA